MESNIAPPTAPPPPPPPPPPPLPPTPPPAPAAQHDSCPIFSTPVSKKCSFDVKDCRVFVDKDRPPLEGLKGLGLMRAMRALDGLRKHHATVAEENTLGASGRLDVQDRAGILALCGCQRGCRLTADEMKTIQRLTNGMVGTWVLLERQFQKLASEIRSQSKTAEQASHQRELGAFFEVADTWLAYHDEVRVLAARKQTELRLESSPSAGTGGNVGSPARAKSLPTFPTWLSTLVERYQIEQGRWLEDGKPKRGDGNPSPESGASTAHELARDTARKSGLSREGEEARQSGLQTSSDTRTTGAVGEGLPVGGSRDPANSKAACITGDGGGAAAGDAEASADRDDAALDSDAATLVDSLARFSLYLALLVESGQGGQTPSTTKAERAALAELLRASDDGSDRRERIDPSLPHPLKTSNHEGVLETKGDRKGGDRPQPPTIPSPSSPPPQPPPPPPPSASPPTPSPPEVLPPSPTRLRPRPSPVGPPRSPRPLRYWARRIHRFLLSVRELKAVPDRDAEALEAIMSELRRGAGRRRPVPSPAAPLKPGGTSISTPMARAEGGSKNAGTVSMGPGEGKTPRG